MILRDYSYLIIIIFHTVVCFQVFSSHTYDLCRIIGGGLGGFKVTYLSILFLPEIAAQINMENK